MAEEPDCGAYPEWAAAYDRAESAELKEWRRQPNVAGEAVDWVVRKLGGRGFGVSKTLRENEEMLASVRAESLRSYLKEAHDEWRLRYRCAPSWLLPASTEFKSPKCFAPGTQLHVDSSTLERFVGTARAKCQPMISVGDATFPDSSRLRTGSDFRILDLAPQELAIFERWFSEPRSWLSFRRELLSIVCRPLPREGLVWRQHRVRPKVDGIDVRRARPGEEFVLPYPVSCRSIPHPMGSIPRPLPGHDAYQSCDFEEENVYLEIWARVGGAMPGRPNSNQDESEVILPPDSKFKIVRHVDLPYVDQFDRREEVKYTHGIQMMQM